MVLMVAVPHTQGSLQPPAWMITERFGTANYLVWTMTKTPQTNDQMARNMSAIMVPTP